jgi:SP family arabinose:H+ symporter-like MFS transporter
VSLDTHTKIDHGSNSKMSYVFFLGATAALGGMMFGFDLAIIVGAGPFLVQHFGLSDLGLGWAYSSLLFGCIFGSVIAGRLTDRYGRQRILLVVAILFFVTSIATGLAPTFLVFTAARFAGGVAVGGVSVLSPLYVAEVSPPRIRGRMGAAYQMSITTGILASYCINYCLRNSGDWNWRWMFISGALPSCIFCLALLRAPETPRFLFRVGRDREAAELLARIMSEDEAALETEEIRKTLVPSTGQEAKQYRTAAVRRVLVIGFVLAILVHCSGIDAIIDYAPLVLGAAGLKIDAALFSTFIIGGINFLCTLVSFWTIDRYGRKPLYIFGSLGMAFALLVVLVQLLRGQFDGPTVLGLMALFIAFFASCIGPVFWTLIPEIFPNEIRGKAMVVPVVTQWIANALMVLLFPISLSQIGKLPTFGFLAAMAILQAFVAWRFVPETKNKSLEEIQAYWEQGIKLPAPPA